MSAANAAAPSPDTLAVPMSMSARAGEGLDLGVSLGGGGVYFVSWQVAYLHELERLGVGLAGADRMVGTSAGSVVASTLTAGNLDRLDKELRVLSRFPRLVGLLAPASDLSPSQDRALELFRGAADNDPATIRKIGHAALAAASASANAMARNLGVILASRRWPSPTLQLTCVDAFSGERCVVTAEHRVPIARAVAASSAVPGLFAPQPILDRRCMDGGVSGSGIHLDLLAGARRAVVLCLTDGAGETVGAMTHAPGAIQAELAALADTGTDVFMRMPETIDMDKLMDPAAVPDAIAMGRRQAAADVAELRSFLA